MVDDSTISGMFHGQGGEPVRRVQPYLVVLAISDDPRAPSSRHLLADIDEVRFGRGPRSAERAVIDGKRVLELHIPDPRMSSAHGRLLRGPLSWVLDDPTSKNGSVVNGDLLRRTIVGDGALLELGHTFLLFCEQPVEAGAADDAIDGELGAPCRALSTFVGPLADGFAALIRLAAAPVSIVLRGDTGTGKEVVARALHALSQRTGSFIAVSCGALPGALVEAELFGHRRGAFTGAVDAFPGVVKAAERGTLFLDEIGDLEPMVQPKLLRFLESGEIQPVGEVRPNRVTVRIVAATNGDLETLAKEGRFRHDLFYRIGVARLELPPLRERKDEIPAFAALFLSRFARECGRTGLRLADDLIAALLLYDWPGNIRQLANEIRRVAAMAADGQTLGAADLTPEVTENWNARPIAPAKTAAPAVEVRLDQPLAMAVAELERKFIEHALHASSGKVADAAQLLGVSRKGLFLKRRRRGLT